MVIPFETSSHRTAVDESPAHVNPILWQQSIGLARQIAARVFRDGGKAADAMATVGLASSRDVGWDKAVELIAGELSRGRGRERRSVAA
ncbi:MAG: hypothetical protein AB7O57_06335 [Hyphomicrobiaceae bacterium]